MKALAAFTFILATTASYAGILWDQSDYDNGANSISKLNIEVTGAFAAASVYGAADFTATSNWTVDSVSFYFVGRADRPDFNASNVDTAKFSIWSKTGSAPLATNDPIAGAVKTVSVTDIDATTRQVTISGLNLSLAAGDYWVNLTPMLKVFSGATSARGDVRFTKPGTLVGAKSFLRNPGNGFGSGTDWNTSPIQGIPDNADIAFKIEGSAVPEPATMIALGLGFVALVRRRKNS